jgi:hypothetical protein
MPVMRAVANRVRVILSAVRNEYNTVVLRARYPNRYAKTVQVAIERKVVLSTWGMSGVGVWAVKEIADSLNGRQTG